MGLLARKAKRLVRPGMTEVSGVDHPAHRSPGWLVMKSEDGVAPEVDADLEAEVIAAVEAEIAAEEASGAGGTDAGDPNEGGSVTTPTTPTTGTPTQGAPASGTEGTGDAGTPDLAAQVETLTKALAVEKAEREKAETARTALAEAVVKSTGGDPTVLTAEAIEKAEFTKALATLPEPIAKAWLADRERITKAEARAEAEYDARVSREYLEKAAGFTHLPTNREGLATVLRAVDGLPKEAATEVHRLLKAADEASARDPLFTPLGSNGEPATGAAAELDARVADIQKSEPALTRPQAVTKALDADPDLDRRVHAENNGGNR